MEFIVKRSSWLRGEGSKHSYLYRSDDQKQCCLGFWCQQIHQLSKQDLKEKQEVFEISALLDYYYLHNDLLEQIIKINDNPKITDKTREFRLKKAFNKLNYQLKFEE